MYEAINCIHNASNYRVGSKESSNEYLLFNEKGRECGINEGNFVVFGQILMLLKKKSQTTTYTG